MTQVSSEQIIADRQLLERTAAKEHAAVSELYDRHATLLYSIILRILRDKSAAEEVLEKIFLDLWNHELSYDERIGSPAAWLARSARDRAVERLRSAGYRNHTSADRSASYDEFFAGDVAESPERLTLLSSQQEQIMIALSMLSDDQKELIEYSYFRGFTLAELAEHFQLPIATAGVKLRSALRILRQKLKQLL